jgi:ABC-type methionine transport system permease subunit
MYVTTTYRIVMKVNGMIRSVRFIICMSLIVPVTLKKMKLSDGSRNVMRKTRKRNHSEGLTG